MCTSFMTAEVYMKYTECHGQVVNTTALYSRGPGLPGDQLSWLRFFSVFLSPSTQMPG
jgi:hypothetical protein